MDYSKARKCSQFIDKAAAVGSVACLEDHFRRITKLLDETHVPETKDGAPLTVFQRVALLATTFEYEFTGSYASARQRAAMASVLEDIADDLDIDFDPEELNAAIDDEKKEQL